MSISRPDMIAIFLSWIAAGCFIASFTLPFVSSDFEVDLPDTLETAVDKGLKGFGSVLSTVGDLLGPDAKDMVNRVGREAAWVALDSMLGEVRLDANGKKVSWSQCLVTRRDGRATGWRDCVKEWIAYKAGLPVGERYVLGVVQDLWNAKEIALSILIALFSFAFPLVKVVMSLWLAIGFRSKRSLRWLMHVSKWSMTDVFIVALLITFFKAESFNFQFKAEIGVYLFAVAAVVSSLAVMRLEQIARRDEGDDKGKGEDTPAPAAPAAA